MSDFILVDNGAVAAIASSLDGLGRRSKEAIEVATGMVGIGYIQNENGGFEAPPNPVPLTVGGFEEAIQAHIDETAIAKLYANGVTLASYANSTNAAWAAEATVFIAWRDAVWLHAYNALAEVQAETRETPTIDGMLAELPVISWP